MADIKLELDDGSLYEMFKEYAEQLTEDFDQAVQNLAYASKVHMLELAEKELHTSKQTFKENVIVQQLDHGVFALTVKGKAAWIEDGIPDNTDMKEKILASPKAKVGKDGVRYMIIPMDQGKPPSQLNDDGKGYLEQLKQGLRDRKIPMRKIEKNEDNSPKLGRLHSFDLGGNIPGKGNTPMLDRVNVYQHRDEKTGKVSRQITTFRTVRADQTDKWIHPGYEGKHFLQRTADWAEQYWENEILPEIMKKYTG